MGGLRRELRGEFGKISKKLRRDLLCLGDRLSEDSRKLCYGLVHSKRNSKP
jgi:hypothetical protein